MSRLDVTEILTDPDFVSYIWVTRTLVSVNTDGLRVVDRQPRAKVIAVVTMNDDLNLLRKPEGENLIGSITVHTKFRLTDGRMQGTDADLIEYQGRQYTVTSMGDWSNWGAGFISVIATLNEVNP